MKAKIELRKLGILKRVLSSSVATSLAKAFRSTGGETPYDEQAAVRLQLFELERQKAEAADLARRRTFA